MERQGEKERERERERESHTRIHTHTHTRTPAVPPVFAEAATGMDGAKCMPTSLHLLNNVPRLKSKRHKDAHIQLRQVNNRV